MKRLSHTSAIQVNAPQEVVLPLLTADGECLWIPGWNPTYIYPESGQPENGMVWTTMREGLSEIWVTVNYDPVQQKATHLKFAPQKHVTSINVRCVPLATSKTTVHITYSMTALSEAGQAAMSKFTEVYYRDMLVWWEKALNHYVEFGETLQEA